MGLDERYEFLGNKEKVISSLQGETLGLFVTNWRLVFLEKMKDGKTRIYQDFDYKHISHIHCESSVGSDYKLIGIFAIILGILLIGMGYGYGDYVYGYGGFFFILGIIPLIAGILWILSKPEQKSVLKISIVGISNPIIFTLATSAIQMDRVLGPLAEMREKTTLRHDPITSSEEATK